MKESSTFCQVSALPPGKHLALDGFSHYDNRKQTEVFPFLSTAKGVEGEKREKANIIFTIGKKGAKNAQQLSLFHPLLF